MVQGKVPQLYGRERGRFVKRVGEKREVVREREKKRESVCVCERENVCEERECVGARVSSNSKHSTLH